MPTVVVQMVLKCADIGHLTVSPRTHRQWACQLEEEFFRQVSSCLYQAPAKNTSQIKQANSSLIEYSQLHHNAPCPSPDASGS